ncbi:MAG: HAD-IIIA family hydrolase [Flavobacteriales bacterium]
MNKLGKAIFLDRDGVINHDPGDYTTCLAEFTLLPTVVNSLKTLHDAGYALIVITNQGGIAKGLYGHAEVAEIHAHFRQLCANSGVELTDIFYSPHHPDYGESLSRKPGSLMIEKACAKHGIDPKKSWMVGDKTRDLEAGAGAGVEGILLPVNGDLSEILDQLISCPTKAQIMGDTLQWQAEKHETFLVNGKLTDETALPNPIRNRGFRYADGFFETIRVVHGKAQHLELHFSRLTDSIRAHQMDHPESLTLDRFTESLQALCSANQIHAGGRIRMTFFRDGGGRYTPETKSVFWVAEAEALEPNVFEINEQGLHVDLYTDMKKTKGPLSNFKNLAATIYVQSAIWAANQELDDALISNEQFQVIESSRSNLFLVSNGVLYTPGLESGPVGGVMRAAIINVALANEYKVYECNLTPQEMLRADELFLTNAIRGIQWVASYRTKRYFNTTSRALVNQLNATLLS